MKNNKETKRSPLFYVGDKYKIIDDIKTYFPPSIDRFIEPFLGGGTVSLNVDADKYIWNDIDENVCELHEFLINKAKAPGKFFKEVKKTTEKYNLSHSYLEDIVPQKLKDKFKKTYYAEFNRKGYKKLRKKYNKSKNKSPLLLYLLIIYGFNRMVRFNKKGEFNVPVGNVDFNNNVKDALEDYFDFARNKKINIYNKDFKDFIESEDFKKDDFIYLDPPYLISSSEYNKLWNVDREKDLLRILDNLNDNDIKFALSNVTHYKGNQNKILINWSEDYNKINIDSNYISYHDNTQKKIKEVLITNYD